MVEAKAHNKRATLPRMNQERYPCILVYGHCDGTDREVDLSRSGWTASKRTFLIRIYMKLLKTELTAGGTHCLQ